MEKRLKELTTTLLKYNEDARKHFTRCRESGESGDFYKEVKPFADQIKELCDEWEPLAIEWTVSSKPKNIYPLQIKNTAENLQMVSVRAFFPESSLKKFHSHIQSNEFILMQVINELETENP